MGLSKLAWTSYEATGATANAEAHICRWKLSSRTMVAAIFHPPGCLSAIYCGQPVSGLRSDPGERTASRSQALGGRGRRSGRFLVQPPCVFLFESVDEPTSGRPRGVGRPIHGRHYDHVALWRCGLARDLNELAACQVRLDHVKRHEAKSKSCAQELMLGSEMGKTPHFRGQQSESTGSRQVRRIGVYELGVLGEDGCRDRCAVG